MKRMVLILLVFLSTSLLAKESGFTLSTALIGMSMDYREYDDKGVILDSEMSSFTGIVGSEFILEYTDVYNNNYLQYGIKISLLGGETDYVGSLINSGLGYGSYLSTTQNSIIDTSIFYMYTNTFPNGLDLGYGIGFAYHSWERALSASQIEVYKWYSIRPKISLTYNFSAFSIGARLEYQYAINPQMDILANYENSSDATVNLGSANIVQVVLPVKYKINDRVLLFIEYVYEKQVIAKSDSTPYVINGNTETIYEPDSTANNQYAKIGATFKF